MSSDVMWRRMEYFLTPQLDIYKHIGPKLRGKAVLEVGFGTGAGTMQFVKFASSVTAIEIDPDAVAFAKSVFPGLADWAQTDILDYCPQNAYDAVVMIEVLEHIPDYRRVLSNIYGMLKPGGVLWMSARNANADLRKNDLHEREWKAAEFVAALREHFPRVSLWDYTLTQEQDFTTRMTPLVGKATK